MARKAYEYALDLLSARGYTTRNLRRKLIQKELAPAEIESAVNRLIDAGLLDDAKYAREFARQKLTTGGSSVRRVQRALVVKGIPSELARDAIDAVMEEEEVDIEHSIESAARKKVASMGDLPIEVKRRRLFAFLARRGFEIDDIRRSINENVKSE